MAQTRMNWIYRIVAIGLVAYGASLVLGDLPPHSGLFPGLGFTLGLYSMALPGILNLVNSFFGRSLALLRWGVVVINIPGAAVWTGEAGDGLWDPPDILRAVLCLTVLILSILLACSWEEASKKAKEEDLS